MVKHAERCCPSLNGSLSHPVSDYERDDGKGDASRLEAFAFGLEAIAIRNKDKRNEDIQTLEWLMTCA